MKKMLVLAMTMAMVLLAAAGVCETLRVGMECNYAPYNWTQSDASENAVAIAAGGYADGYDVRIAKIIADKLGMDLEIVKTEWDGLTPALLSGNIDVIIAGMSPTAERKMTIDFTDSSTRRPAKMACSRRASSPKWRMFPALCSPSWTARPRAALRLRSWTS